MRNRLRRQTQVMFTCAYRVTGPRAVRFELGREVIAALGEACKPPPEHGTPMRLSDGPLSGYDTPGTLFGVRWELADGHPYAWRAIDADGHVMAEGRFPQPVHTWEV